MSIRGALAAMLVASIVCMLPWSASQADSKLLATAGGQQLEGQAGGGLVPWALMSGYGDADEWGMSAAVSKVRVNDFELDVGGLAFNLGNRAEISIARQRLQVKPLGLTIRQDIIGGKLRLAGDVLYGDLPLITAGLQSKHNRDDAVPLALGASERKGLDFTLSSARLWLDAVAGRNVFANITLRNTAANQMGLLGFGAKTENRSWVAEGSLGIFLNRHWILGAEYRQKPNHLSSVSEDDWMDIFLGWFPNKRVSIIGAYTDLGSIAGLPDQTGFYLSLQLTR